MGGKTSTSSSSVAIPPSVLSEYNAVTANANQVAETPFSTYTASGTPVSSGYTPDTTGTFVAPTNATQQQGINDTTASAGLAQPYYTAANSDLFAAQGATTPVNDAATGLAASSSTLTGADVNNFLSPYLGDVLDSTEALQNQSNQQAESGELGNAISSGAFGGDRTGIAAANLQENLDLENSNVISGIANQGFASALGAAQSEQNIGLQGASTLAGIGQTAYGEGANTASEEAALGTGAQTAALTGAQADIAAGTVQQQTQQAEDTAEYNQFLQQQSYPFEVGSWEAGIAEGIGTNEGSTTTTTQPGGFFSDRRLKRDIKKIGETFDGQPIYSYKMGDDDRTRVGLIAQNVEKKHPDAVGLADGWKMVDYGKATERAANKGHFAGGGLVVPMRRVHRDTGGGLDSVLQAQQQMYSGMGGGQTQRQLPSQSGGSGGHLTPTNAPATAPKSGMSDVTQTVGLANDVNKLSNGSAGSGISNYAGGYTQSPFGAGANQLNTITPAGSEMTIPDDAAGLQSSGATTFAAPAAEATAAPAATDAAAGAAADAGTTAAAGAATDAAAGVATDAAAEEAAALAAEYAAADVGVAAIAARRGGSIRRGYEAGGMPYSQEDGEYDIPSEAYGSDQLKAAPAAGKQPTGLQTLMYMGDPNNTSSLAGSMFSNQALATGGIARSGYDDGGDVAPEPDASDLDAPAPDVVATPADSSSSGGSGGLASVKGWWDKNKQYVLPALSGLAAMGTAKTVHPGVALAAGLGAGAESYLDTQGSLAKTGQTQALTQGTQLDNQLKAMQNKAAAKWLNPTPGQPSTAAAAIPASTAVPSGTPSGPGVAGAASLDSYYRNKYYIPPITPDEATAMQQASGAALALKSDVPVQQVQRQIDQRVAAQTSANRNAAQNDADQRYQAATDPNAAPADKALALAHYNALFQWTGDKPEDRNGNLFNSRTGQPMIGAQAQTLNQGQQSANLAAARELVLVPQSDHTDLQEEAWIAHHAASPEAYAASLNPGAQPASAAGVQPRNAAATPARGAPVPQPGAPVVATSGDPYLDKALADQTWRMPTQPVVSGRTQSPQVLNRNTIATTKAADLRAQYDQATSSAATSNQYLKAAQDILDSKGAAMGAYGGLIAGASQYLPLGHTDATNYQEVSKYLVNAAVQAGKVSFANPTQSEVGLQTGEMSPNKTMTDDALHNLVRTGIRANNFVMDSGNRVEGYLGSGAVPNNDPQNFEKWNQKWFPRDKMVNATRTASGPNGQKLYLVNGKWTP